MGSAAASWRTAAHGAPRRGAVPAGVGRAKAPRAFVHASGCSLVQHEPMAEEAKPISSCSKTPVSMLAVMKMVTGPGISDASVYFFSMLTATAWATACSTCEHAAAKDICDSNSDDSMVELLSLES